MYNYNQPVQILHQPGIIQKLGDVAAQYGKKAFVVTGSTSARKTGLMDKVEAILNRSHVAYYIFDKAEANPLTTTAMLGAKLYKEESCDLVIGIGGGSAMDCAKAIAFLTKNDGDLSDYIMGVKEGKDAAPIILATTTAGTGTEGNCLAVLTNPKNNDKKSLKHESIYAKVSLVDPELMSTLPPRYIASCGFDAFSHCFEAYTARRCTPETEALALEGIQMIFENLVTVYHDPYNMEAFSKVAHANTIGGIVINHSGVNLPHGLEHPVSGLLNVSHGEGLAAIYPAVLAITKDVIPDKLIKIGALVSDVNATDEEKIDHGLNRISELMDALNLNMTLSDLGVKAEHIDWLVDNAYRTMGYAIENHPITPTDEDLKEIYRKCLTQEVCQ